MLEALLKRVDGLEKRLHSEGKSESAIEDDIIGQEGGLERKNSAASSQSRPTLEISPNATNAAKQLISPIEPRYTQTIPARIYGTVANRMVACKRPAWRPTHFLTHILLDFMANHTTYWTKRQPGSDYRPINYHLT